MKSSMMKIIISLLLMSLSSMTHAVLKIDITEGSEGALPIAVVPFQWKGVGKVPNADVSAIIASDLARSGKFSPVAESNLIARPQKIEDVHYKTWRIAGMDHIVIGGVTAQKNGEYQVAFRLIDILKGKQVLGYSLMQPEILYVLQRIKLVIIFSRTLQVYQVLLIHVLPM